MLAAAAATALIISPVAFHRALFRQGRKPELVRFAHRMATGGLAFMLIAMVSAVLLITDFVLDRPIAFVLSGLAGALVPHVLGGPAVRPTQLGRGRHRRR